MTETITIKKKIKDFNKRINISGDKSLSIRWVLFASLASGVSKSKHLLMSEDVLAAINAIKKLGIKVKFNKDFCKIYGMGINGYKYKKNLTINAQNSGTLGRIILGLLINSPYAIKVVGDKSCIKLIDFFLHLFAKTLFSGHGRSTTMSPLISIFLHLAKKLFSPY